MRKKLKVLLCGSVLLACTLANTEEKTSAAKTPQPPPVNPKFIKLNVKMIKKSKKVKTKEKFVRPSTTSDLNHDDKTDFVTLIVYVENRNKVEITGYKLSVEFFGKSVTEKRPPPEVFKNFEESIDKLEARKKFRKEFEASTTYDKSEDIASETSGNSSYATTYNTRTHTTPAFGSCFYGYRIRLLDSKGEVINTVLWPSGLKKYFDQLEKQKKKEKKEKTEK